MNVRRVAASGLLILVALTILALLALVRTPARLSDQDLWKLMTDVSEANGFFRSDNLLSNEISFQHALLPLSRATRTAGAYLGVGPEQNFTYILALKPAISFIIDIRRGYLDLHLMYKALFELSTDRPDFVSRLFARKRPAWLGVNASAKQIFDALLEVEPADDYHAKNLSDIRNQLVTVHHLPLPEDDLKGIEYVYRSFYSMGPLIQYSPFGSADSSTQPTYAELMQADDGWGNERGFLASEANFSAIRDYERRNLIVPVVGNFSGLKAIRAIGRYLKDHNVSVSAFYVSNVEEYLRGDGTWNAFCGNIATLPLDRSSTFIRSVRSSGAGGLSEDFISELKPMLDETRSCAANPQP
jgi:hypothetical protein